MRRGVLRDMDARRYHEYKPVAMRSVLQSFERLRSRYGVVMVEGAGSPAEINLREGDIANMGFAEAADIPVLLAADIDRGGVFAHIVGTLGMLYEEELKSDPGAVSLMVTAFNRWVEEEKHSKLRLNN